MYKVGKEDICKCVLLSFGNELTYYRNKVAPADIFIQQEIPLLNTVYCFQLIPSLKNKTIPTYIDLSTGLRLLTPYDMDSSFIGYTQYQTTC